MLWWKLVLTTVGLLLVMAAAQWGGRRVAGLVAALPTITGPTLAWTAWEQGTGFAVQAAIASVASCAALAVFALAYVHASRRLAAAGALACGMAAAAAVTVPVQSASHSLPVALAVALGVTRLAWAALPAPCAASVKGLRACRPSLATAGAVGGLTALITTCGPALGAFATGLLASLPLVSGPLAVAEHRASGHHASTEFLRGYVRGLFGKAAFGAVFALVAPAGGVMPALALASAAVCAVELRPWSRLGMPRLHSSAR